MLPDLPLHPLLVHVAVVMVPVTVLAVLLVVVLPRFRAWLDWGLPVVGITGGFVAWRAAQLGDRLAEDTQTTPILEEHFTWRPSSRSSSRVTLGPRPSGGEPGSPPGAAGCRLGRVDTAAVLDLLRDVAERVINPRFRDLSDGQVMEKNPGDLVTVADHEAEELITEALATAYPDAVILGEEAHAADPALMERYLAAEHAFTVDPVDGTKNFVHGSRDHAVMVAEVREGRTMRGWIWQPQHRTGYVAELGQGVRRDGVLLRRQAPRADAPATLDVRTSHRLWVGSTPGPLRPLELTWVCCGVDYPSLVQGLADAVLYTRTKPWDHAPGSLMATEAGGFVGTFDGTTYGPQGSTRGIVVAADRATYDVVQHAVQAL